MVFPLIPALVMGAAGIAGSAISGAATSKATKAAKEAAAANDARLRESEAKIEGMVSPFVQPAYGATNKLSAILGVNGSQPSYMNPLAGVAQGKPAGGMAGVSPVEGAEQNPLGAVAQRGQSQTPDWAAYGAANPDILAWAQAGGGDPAAGPNQTMEQRLAYHYANSGQAEGRQLPTTTGPATNPLAEAAAYGPQVGQRANPTRPDAGTAPERESVSLDAFEASPDYEFRQKEAARSANNYYGAKGVLGSGGAIKAILERASNLAAGEYGDFWDRRNSTWQTKLGQFNIDRNVGNDNFNIDRARSDGVYDTDRGYATSRFDTNVNDLFRLSGQGLDAAGTLANVNQNTSGAMAANNNSRADTVGNAAIAGANNVNGLIGNALSTYGMITTGGATPKTTTAPKKIGVW